MFPANHERDWVEDLFLLLLLFINDTDNQIINGTFFDDGHFLDDKTLLRGDKTPAVHTAFINDQFARLNCFLTASDATQGDPLLPGQRGVGHFMASF